MAGHAGDDAHGVADLTAIEAAQYRPCDLGPKERRGKPGDIEHQPRPAVLGAVQTVIRRAAGDGAGDVEEIAVAVGARAQH